MEPYDPTRSAYLAKKALEALTASPCIGCDETVHEGMAKPLYTDDYLDQLAGPNEMHDADPEGHCENPKCRARMGDAEIADAEQYGEWQCPKCGRRNVEMEREFAPGGKTRAGLSLDDMGEIGENAVFRMGELPGIGVIESTFPSVGGQKSERDGTVDMIVRGADGTRYGCEIKANHSQAQERFKIGDRAERLKKLAFCAANGLAPALVGVRLNFYTDKAFVFWREGLTDTWMGNKKMKHIATVDFADLNPFQSPDANQKKQAIDAAQLPDQSVDADIDAAFGPEVPGGSTAFSKVATDEFEHEHPRSPDSGEFVVKHDMHEVKVLNKAGKHVATAKRCVHCGWRNYIPADHRGRAECSCCGEDIERKLKLTKVLLSGPNEDIARHVKDNGWEFSHRTGKGERVYTWTDTGGNLHRGQCGSGEHGSGAAMLDYQHLRQRMRNCMSGKCFCITPEGYTEQVIPPVDEPGAPVLRAGTTIEYGGKPAFLAEIAGDLAVIQDLATGVEDVVPLQQLRAVGSTEPDFLFVFYMGKLKVEPYHHNTKTDQMLEALLKEHGYGDVPHDLDPTKVAAGEVYEYSDGSLKVEHKSLTELPVREEADEALAEWVKDKDELLPALAGGDEAGGEDDDDDADRAEDSAIANGEYEHWRRLPRDEDGQWAALY